MVATTFNRESSIYELKHRIIQTVCPITHTQLDPLRIIYQGRTWWPQADAQYCRSCAAAHKLHDGSCPEVRRGRQQLEVWRPGLTPPFGTTRYAELNISLQNKAHINIKDNNPRNVAAKKGVTQYGISQELKFLFKKGGGGILNYVLYETHLL